MKFLLVLEQKGGCDYTIGCGMTTLKFSVLDKKDAPKRALSEIVEQFGDPATGYIDKDITRATLYAITDYQDLDLKQYRYDYKERLAKEAMSLKEAQERTELERLERKYRS